MTPVAWQGLTGMDERLDPARLDALDAAMAAHVAGGTPQSLAYAVVAGGQVHRGAVGADGKTIFRIASMSKPVTAVAALTLVEDGTIALDDPVDELVPELADRMVLVPGATDLTQVVPAERPITVDDLLTFRMGLGLDFSNFGGQLTLNALGERGLPVGPPMPDARPDPDEVMRLLGTVPLEAQPGERWLYHVGADVLSVLLARAAGRSLPELLAERVFGPLGMVDTGFHVPPEDLHRFGPCDGFDPATGEPGVYDPPDGAWSRPPAFASGGDGLVSTVDDYLTFAQMLLAGGTWGDVRILTEASVATMTTDHLSDAQRADGPDPAGTVGWGYCVGVQRGDDGVTGPEGTYGWDGGLGSSWANDPANEVAGVLMTSQMFTSPALPEVCVDFWSAARSSVA
jgi:CubicO group peptidase (beta-lactamase class C family)